MPAPKPSGLNERHSTKSELAGRESAEESLRPSGELQKSAPKSLEGHKVAAQEWRSLIKLYSSLEATIVSKLDQGSLLDYCILIEQIGELDDLRRTAFNGYEAAKKIVLSYEDEGVDLKVLSRAVDSLNVMFEQIVKLDGRVDRKRALLLQLRQSLYLTPRARAGVAPKTKEIEPPASEMDNLLNDDV